MHTNAVSNTETSLGNMRNTNSTKYTRGPSQQNTNLEMQARVHLIGKVHDEVSSLLRPAICIKSANMYVQCLIHHNSLQNQAHKVEFRR